MVKYYIIAYFLFNIALLFAIKMKNDKTSISSDIWCLLLGLPLSILISIAYLIGTLVGAAKKGKEEVDNG